MTADAALISLLNRPLPKRIMLSISARGGEARFVGGVVRDVLNGISPEALHDVDMAADRPPEECCRWLEKDGLHVVPTGIDHGTITVVDPEDKNISVHLTSLRADIRTDGRHAEVVFGTDWDEDAKRRDFTINAIYLSKDGAIFDPLGGHADLKAGVVRFVGDAAGRIVEDYLRMLRFFRFHARFGRGEPDAAAMAAISRHAGGLKRISGERVAQEMRGILEEGDAGVIMAMAATGLDGMVVPGGFATDGYERLAELAPSLEPMHLLGFLIRRPGSLVDKLIPFQKTHSEKVASRLRLSRQEADLLKRAAAAGEAEMFEGEGWERYAYAASRDVAPGILAGLYAVAAAKEGGINPDVHARLRAWVRPEFPLKGEDLIACGMKPGQAMGARLKALEERWVAAGFTPGREGLLAELVKGENGGMANASANANEHE